MTQHLRYGRNGLNFEWPAGFEPVELHLNPLPPLADPAREMMAALRRPLGTPPLAELAAGKKTACIVVCDVTRPVPNQLILEAMLPELERAGVARESITILVATGLHRPNLGAELEEMLGPHIVSTYRVENHYARRDEDMVDLGEVEFGAGQTASVAVNRHYVEADLKITTGLIEPHFMAGYSGGRKVICPGIASAGTILQFHSPPMIGAPQAIAGNLEGNPIHAMSRAVAGRTGCDFICNVTLNEERRVTGVFCGDLDEAHQAGIRHVDLSAKVPVNPAPVVVTSGAGYPLDTTFYQCIKGMVGALPALEKGGSLILVSSLSEGVGSEEFAEMCFSLRSREEFLARINREDVRIDQWQLQEMMKVLEHAGEVYLVSDGLEPAVLEKFLVRPCATVEEALKLAALRLGASRDGRCRAVVIPEGPYVTPVALAA